MCNSLSPVVFTSTLTYVIQRELGLLAHAEHNFNSLLKDGLIGKCPFAPNPPLRLQDPD